VGVTCERCKTTGCLAIPGLVRRDKKIVGLLIVSFLLDPNHLEGRCGLGERT